MSAGRPRGPIIVVAAVEFPGELLDVETEALAGLGATILDLRDRPLGSILADLARADALLTEGIERVDATVIAAMRQCRVIGVYAVGTDGIDVAAATARRILVANVPDYCTIEVAEHTIALVLAAWRRIPRAERVARSGSWAIDDLQPVRRLAGRTLGLLGYGRIAREVAVRAQAFGVNVIAHDPYIRAQSDADDVRLCGREELLRASDILSIHLPATAETVGSVEATALALLPEGAILVNAGRGAIVDETALLAALQSGRLAAAAVDVLSCEPPPVGHPLLALDTVICTPHMAYYSEESVTALRRRAATNVRLVLEGRMPASVVNGEALR
ncbi:MAG: D-3-phosphoglycerate dehydrogenase / 2-oxoglutarate reductase [Gaiellales bacterium]|nr:D-3-phosphoglycerate dehydrogenase / 2-oxoglutarate reductase [Gaiellales bacterium]